MKNDRRQEPRKVPQALAFIQVEKDEGGRVLNISESGLCFEVFSTIRVTEAVRFWFTFNLSDRIEAFGRLVWIDATKRIGGLTFTKLSQAARKQIRYWTSRMPLSEPPIIRGTPLQAPEVRIPNAPLQVAEVQIPNAPLRTRDTPFQAPEIRSPNTPLQTPELRSPNVPLQAPVPHNSSRSLLTPPPAGISPPHLPVPKLEITEKTASPLAGGSIFAPPHESSSEGHLVPFERHRRTARSQFLRGLVVGVAVSAAVAMPIFKFAQAGRSSVAAQQSPKLATSADPNAAAGAQGANTSPQPLPASFAPLAKSHDSRPNLSSHGAQTSDSFSPSAGRSPSSLNKAASSDSPSVDPYTSNDAARSSKSWKSPKQLWAAVQAGNTNAAVILADHYIHGDGVPVNCDQARVLLLVASEKNNKAAIQKLRDLDKTGCPQTQTPSK